MYENNARSVFEEANNALHGGTDFNELRTYLLTKLMWNPYCDIERHRKEFMEYYYGDAAPILDKYLNLLCDYTEKDNYHLYIQDIQRPAALSEERIDEWCNLERSYRALLDGRDRGVHYTTSFRYDPETVL